MLYQQTILYEQLSDSAEIYCCCGNEYYTIQAACMVTSVRGSSQARDHADLLLSSKYWPLVYAVDMACDVVAHIEARDPQLANALWGERRGCFEEPSKRVTPKV